MSKDQIPPAGEGDEGAGGRTKRPDDGPVQTRKSPEGAAPDRQIAQESQQSTGLSSGQS